MLRTLILSLLVFFSLSVDAQVNLTAGLVAYYPFNGSFADASSNGNNGTGVGGVAFGPDRLGNPNSAAFFDGVDDWISVPSPSFTFGHKFSIAFRFKTNASQHQVFMANTYPSTYSGVNFQVGMQHPFNPGGIYLGTNHNGWCSNPPGGNFDHYTPVSSPVPAGQWHCVAMTFDNGVKSIYFNGILAMQQTVAVGANPTMTDSCEGLAFRIGTWWPGDPRFFNGLMDDVRLYNRALNPQEIDSLCSIPPVDIIINNYAAIQTYTPCNNSFAVDDATGFNVGDTVLMIQMKGATIDSSNTASFGNVIDYRGAGNYEYNVVKARTGNTIILKYRVIKQYNIPDGKVQFVRVPSYQNYVVNKSHTSMAWNGAKGGVFVVNVANALTLNQTIDVSGKGFKGGQFNHGTTYFCNQQNYFYPLAGNDGGMKGEGITEISDQKMRGKGRLANGGGGGNNTNAGGGGGSNAGAGGLGGHQWANCDTTAPLGGIQGVAFTYSALNNRLYFGGGGGCGQENNSNTDAGGDGAGIIILNAGSIAGNGFAIRANGMTCANTNASTNPNGDGQSGGGAGGTVLFKVNTFSSLPVVEAKGGNGGNIYSPVLHGPGGGGGGGAILFSTAAIPAANINTVGGLNGMVIALNSAHSAGPGRAGVILSGIPYVFPADTFRPNVIIPAFTDSTVNCFTRKLINTTTVSGVGIASWSWNASIAGTSVLLNPTFTFPDYGSYVVKLIAVDSNGCSDSATLLVTIPYVHFARAGNDTTTCTGVAAMLHASGGVSYSWSPAATLGTPNAATTTAMPSVNTTYIVTVTDTSGCPDQDTAMITMLPGDQVIVSPQDTLVCMGKDVQLHAAGVVSYQWSPATDLSNTAIADPVASFKRTITYKVTGKDHKGCTSYDSISLRQRPAPDVDAYSFGDLTVSCFDHSVKLHASGATQYTWQPGRYVNDSLIADPLASPPQTMLFTVTGVDEYGCSAQDTITVFSYKEAVVFVPDAFTPNGDGRNDAIRPLIYCDFNFERFEIFNRWGQQVFMSYRNDKGWDGNFKGEAAPLGVYMWYVKGHRDNGDAVLYRGDVTLIR